MEIDNDPRNGTVIQTEEQDISDIAALLGDPEMDDAEPDVGDEGENEPDTEAAEDDGFEDLVDDDEVEEPEADAAEEQEAEPQTDVELTLTDGRKVNRKQIEAAFQAERDIKAALTPKFQEVAAIRKELDTEKQVISQQKQMFEQVVPFAQAVLEQMIPQPATEEEHMNDPIGAMAKDRAYQRAQAQLNALQQSQRIAMQQAQEEQQKEVINRQREMWTKAAERRADLRDRKGVQEYNVKLSNYLLGSGFPEESIKSIDNDSILQIVEKAMAYDELKAKAPKVEKKAANAMPVAQPKARQAPQNSRDAQRKTLEKKLRQTGDPRYADALFMDLID